MRRNRKKKVSINPKIILISALVLCGALIFASFRFSEQLSPVKEFVGNLISPMQKGIAVASDALNSKIRVLTDAEGLLEENEKLKEKVALLQSENQLLTQEKYELGWYRELYELDGQYSDYEKVGARVISKETNSYYNVFTLDKGRDDGIQENMNVIAGNGLVGLVTETGANWCKVRSIIDDRSNVSGMFLKTSDTCIVKGDLTLLDSGYIRVELIDKDAEVYDNYEIVTSYISDRFLPGILIGYVSNIEEDPITMTKHAYLTPVVDFEHLDAVLIIKAIREPMKD